MSKKRALLMGINNYEEQSIKFYALKELLLSNFGFRGKNHSHPDE